MFTLTIFFPTGSPNLGAQIRCAQNRYTALQTDLKYPTSQSHLLFTTVTLTASSFQIKGCLVIPSPAECSVGFEPGTCRF